MITFIQAFMLFGMGSALSASLFYLLIERERRYLRRRTALAASVINLLNVDDYLAIDDEGTTHLVEHDDLDFVWRCTKTPVDGRMYHYMKGTTLATRRATCLLCLGA